MKKQKIHIFSNFGIDKLLVNLVIYPIAEQVVGTSHKSSHAGSDLLKIHEKIKETGTYNFLKARIQVPYQLNIEAWEANLQEYWDKQLLQLIQYCFTLSFGENVQLISSETNHNLAKNYPTLAYIYKMRKHLMLY